MRCTRREVAFCAGDAIGDVDAGSRAAHAAVDRRTGVIVRQIAVVDVAVDAAGDQVAIIDIPGQQQMLGQELRAGEVHEIQKIVR